MTDPQHFMAEAVRLSREGPQRGEGGPFGAVIVRDGTVVGQSWNKTLLHCDPTAHAEVEAIRDACRRLGTTDLSGCVLYCSAEPCPMCLAAVYWSHIDTVYFANTSEQAAAAGFEDCLIYQELRKDRGERRVPGIHVPRADASQVLADWPSS